jgi:DNA-binding NtrC family response regulator
MKRLLIVEDKESLALMLKETVESEGLEADLSPNGSDATRRIAEGRRYFAVVTDLRLPGADGIAVLRAVKESDPDCPVIVMTAFGTIENAVEAMKLGAFDFVQKPVDVDHLLLLLRRCREHRELLSENLLLKEEFQQRYRLPAIIGDSAPIVEVGVAIQRVAPTDSTVLLAGESGTGKELFARAIHQLSPRRERPFVAINCAAIPDTLIENELFGHERGAFTGATGRQLGKFELADNGTIFLDEIGELNPSMQSKLLRVLQERRFDRIGGVTTVDVDVRVICATNRNLADDVRSGRFREDLFFRINVFPVTVPPLRARRGDIDALTDFFVQKFARELKKPGLRIAAAARARRRPPPPPAATPPRRGTSASWRTPSSAPRSSATATASRRATSTSASRRRSGSTSPARWPRPPRAWSAPRSSRPSAPPPPAPKPPTSSASRRAPSPRR